MSGGPGGDDGKLPSVDHGRRTDRGRDKQENYQVTSGEKVRVGPLK